MPAPCRVSALLAAALWFHCAVVPAWGARRPDVAYMGAPAAQDTVWELASLWPLRWHRTVPYLGTSGKSNTSIYLYAKPPNQPEVGAAVLLSCLLYTSPSPRD